jgi:hypothetical protein
MDAQPLEVAIRLADEGVPLRAIARATKVSSSDLREALAGAKSEGRLLELPHDDWPPGFPRDQRALQLSRLMTKNKDAILPALLQLFKLSPTQVEILLELMQRPMLIRNGSGMADSLDVHVCRLRKCLAPYGIEIMTLWGHGYSLSPQHRRRAMDLILNAAG